MPAVDVAAQLYPRARRIQVFSRPEEGTEERPFWRTYHQGKIMLTSRCNTSRRSGSLVRPKALIALAAILATVSVTAVAMAAGTTLEIGHATIKGNSKPVVVDAHGLTLYELSNETITNKHANLKCINKTCFEVWAPYKVTKNQRLTKATGITGTIGRLQRVKAKFFQVMLNNHPLYTYVGDNGTEGSAKGNGIKAFGGTWTVVSP
jgi:predicted lipoprotein with Yx(FWY)xxD motif